VTQPADNAARWRWDSDPFGTNAPNENPSGLGVFKYNLRFPGQQYDGLAGLYYNYFRDYDAATGRYVESDPVGLRGGIDTYVYSYNLPTDLTDPLGLEPQRHGESTRKKCEAADYEFCNRFCGSKGVLGCGVYFTHYKKRVVESGGRVFERIVSKREVRCECGDDGDREPVDAPTCGETCKKSLVAFSVGVVAVCCAAQPEICALGIVLGTATK